MHELSIAQSMLEVIESNVTENGYTRCTAVTVRAGLLSAVDEEALRFAFETLSEQTAHSGSTLSVERTFPTAKCDCGCSFKVTEMMYACPDCGAVTAALSGGDELEVIKLEVE
jgi:hydrogenase nickel incorporation protein HypA/HybF